MPFDSPQSRVPLDVRSGYQLVRDLTSAPDVLVNPPRILTGASTVANPAIPYQRGQAVRTLENEGTVAVYWGIGVVPTADTNHGVLKACTVADDGTGGFVDLSRVPGIVHIAPVTGSTCKVATMIAQSHENIGT